MPEGCTAILKGTRINNEVPLHCFILSLFDEKTVVQRGKDSNLNTPQFHFLFHLTFTAPSFSCIPTLTLWHKIWKIWNGDAMQEVSADAHISLFCSETDYLLNIWQLIKDKNFAHVLCTQTLELHHHAVQKHHSNELLATKRENLTCEFSL